MKKFIFFMILFCTVFSVHSQIMSSTKEDTITIDHISYTRLREYVEQIPSSIPDSAKVTFSHVYNDMKEGILGIAAALKVGTENVYKILIRQQIVKSCSKIILFIIGFIMLYFPLNRYINKKEILRDKDGEPTLLGVVRTMQFATGGFLFFYGIISSDDIITGFINPEYGAIMEIMDFVKK